MYHSITIGDKNTWNDWHLVPTKRPFIAPPTVNTKYADIPGRDGSLDLTTALSGKVTYTNRSGQLDFYIDNDFMPWQELYSTILNYVQGKNFKMVLEDDPYFYYEGRLSVPNYSPGSNWSQISLSYNLAPYKRLLDGATRYWLWDTFNFSTGVINQYSDIPISGETEVEVEGAPIIATPIITSSVGGITVAKGDNEVTLTQGDNWITAFTISPGSNTLTFDGTGTVSIDFDGRSL